MKKIKQKILALSLCLALVTLIVILGTSTTVGATAELSLSPATKTVDVRDNFNVDVQVNTGGQNVVVVGAYLNYDPTKLEVIGIDTSNSVFTMPIEKTADPTTGMIKLAFSKPTPGVNTASGNVATVNFKALAQASPAYVSFVMDSDRFYTCVLLDDGKGTDILGSVKNGAYFIGGGGQPPTVSFTYVPDDYPTIQAAVNVASAGDTIIVRDGTYNENVKVNKRLTIQSENGANSTIVQAANSSDHVFEVTADYVTISGFTVEGANEDWPNYKAGIYINRCGYCNISNNIALNNDLGIHLDKSYSHILINNIANQNRHVGIWLYESSNNSLINNIAESNNDYGFFLCFFSNNNALISNIASEKDIGISLRSSSNNHVLANTVSNTIHGIGLELSSNNNTIVNNTVLNNWDGLRFYESFNNIITKNTVTNNSYGIYLYSSNNSFIYLNDFRNNANNIYYNESANLWNSTEKITYTYNGIGYTKYLGNYWDDYSGTDANGDGIGDTPYPIESDKDNYPLITPWQNHIGVPVTRTNAELFLSPSTKTVNVGDSFSVDVLVNTDGQNVVAVGAYLNYDQTKLEVIGIDNSNSVFTMPIEKTADPTTGMIKLATGKPTPGVNTASGNVATINFKAIAQASPAYVSFVTDSDQLDTCVLLDDGKGTDILGSVKNGDYFIGGGGAQPPTVTSTGTISVSSSPSGAGITFDGVPINAITPHTITYVEPGHHTIKLTLESYQDWSTEVYVIAGETSHVDIALAETSTP